jgi:Tfp pilus assembly protein PilN
LIVLTLGGAMGAAWGWNLRQASASLNATLTTQSTELEGLRAALAKNQANLVPAQSVAEKALAGRREELERRAVVLDALQQGYFQPGLGQSARLQLVAQTIPAEAWVTQLTADERSLQVTGFTLEPAVLTTWVNRLAASPLLQGQSLSTVKVDQVKPDTVLSATVPTGASSASVPKVSKPEMWSFALQSSMAAPIVLPGAKP